MSNNNVENALDLIRPLFEEAQAYVDTMSLGDKVPATKLAQTIAEHHGQTGPQIYPTLKVFFDSHDELEVRRGAHGGLFKIESKAKKAAEAAEAKRASEIAVVVDDIKENVAQ